MPHTCAWSPTTLCDNRRSLLELGQAERHVGAMISRWVLTVSKPDSNNLQSFYGRLLDAINPSLGIRCEFDARRMAPSEVFSNSGF